MALASVGALSRCLAMRLAQIEEFLPGFRGNPALASAMEIYRQAYRAVEEDARALTALHYEGWPVKQVLSDEGYRRLQNLLTADAVIGYNLRDGNHERLRLNLPVFLEASNDVLLELAVQCIRFSDRSPALLEEMVSSYGRVTVTLESDVEAINARHWFEPKPWQDLRECLDTMGLVQRKLINAYSKLRELSDLMQTTWLTGGEDQTSALDVLIEQWRGLVQKTCDFFSNPIWNQEKDHLFQHQMDKKMPLIDSLVKSAAFFSDNMDEALAKAQQAQGSSADPVPGLEQPQKTRLKS